MALDNMVGQHVYRWLTFSFCLLAFIGCGRYALTPDESDSADNTNTVTVENGEATIVVTPGTRRYPRLELTAGIEGDVEIGVVTDHRGKPTEKTVIQATNRMLEHAAIEIVSNSVFVDSRRLTPMQGSFKVIVRFRLDGS
ncbi:MAG: energy transducer TonB [Candidatus Zixiibacteriota bacterium]|nr:MAG: energy transducer TonB [candidate division Zixibacteria bacterium]